MGDFYGPLPLPAPAAASGEAVGDPALDVLLPFLKALLIYYGDKAWQSVATFQNTGPNIVVGAFAFDPNEQGGIGFNSRDLPALFLFREELETSKWIAADYWVRPSKLVLLWVPPPVPQATRVIWQPIMNLIGSILDGICDPHARVPGYILPGDDDPIAQYQGSLIYRFLPFVWEFDVGPTKRVPVKIKMADGSPDENFFGTRTEILLRERASTDDPTVNAFEMTGGVLVQGIQNRELEIIPDAYLRINVSGIEPTHGAGQIPVVIFGTGFATDLSVFFGDVQIDPEEIEVRSGVVVVTTAPDSTALGPVVVTVRNANNEESTTTFTYV